MKRVAIIGHRGTGKSAFLKRVADYYAEKPVRCFDLDREIEARSGKSISQIFQVEGEEVFRRVEHEVFLQILSEVATVSEDVYVALGAGFDPTKIPESWQALWLRRATDVRGRIFTDRPRLNAHLSPLEEFAERFLQREAPFRARADEILMLDEGLENADPTEREFVLGSFRNLGGAITVLSEQFRNPEKFEQWAKARLKWGVRFFELRDDLLSEEQIETALRALPDDRVLVSFRQPGRERQSAELIGKHGLAFDWPVERGACEIGEPRFLSSHARAEGESLESALERFPLEIPEGAQLKAALPIHNFKELETAHKWREAARDQRLFLPLSADGRWYWYRLLQPPGLNFFREGDGSGADQPTLLQWARRRSLREIEGFAAILGDPVAHSRTPLEQREFFAFRDEPVFAIRVTEEEWRQGALDLLKALGLREAAVTAPLKSLAYEACTERAPIAETLKSVNTLQWRSTWRGTNTDLEGFQSLVRLARAEFGELAPIAIWGGGGTLSMMQTVLPEAIAYSLRTGEPRSTENAKQNPTTVVWAAGGVRGEGTQPPAAWKPRLVIDLNYGDDSSGRTFAFEKGAKYVSGLPMFRAQAQAQRKFWSEVQR